MSELGWFLLGFTFCAILLLTKEVISMVAGWNNKIVTAYKLSYYETKLELDGYDISKTKNITARQIFNRYLIINNGEDIDE